MTRLSVQVAWRQIGRGRTHPHRGDFQVIELLALGDSRIYAARVNNSGMPAVILDVPASDNPEPFSDTRTPCISWSSSPHELRPDRIDLVLELKHPLLGDVFGALAEHVFSFILDEQDRFRPAVAARIAFERWHKLFNPASNGLPPGFPNVDRLKWKLLGTFPKPASSRDHGENIPF